MDEIVNRKEAFFLNNFNIDKVFDSIEKADYLFLYYIRFCAEKKEETNRVYLADLAEIMKMKIPELSRAVENLQNKGYVLWQTDHEVGKTYVELTSKAVELMSEERKRMESCYERIQKEIGMEEMEKTVQVMRKITKILSDSAMEE